MSSTLTIRNLDDSVQEKLRERAAIHGHSIEAEAREILIRDILNPNSSSTPKPVGQVAATAKVAGKFDHLVGIWSGRMTTDEIMKLTRGE